MFNQTVSDQPEETTQGKPPLPDLCHKCGKCCNAATTYHSYETLQKMVADGEQSAIDFLDVFQPFPSHEAARQIVPEQVEQVLKIATEREDMDPNDVTFYHCRYVTEEGLCGIYERRPLCCQQAPGHGWSAMPPGCGFEGWQFEQRENHRAEIRRLKQTQFQMETLSTDGIHLPTRDMTLDELREVVAKAIAPWKVFGADYW